MDLRVGRHGLTFGDGGVPADSNWSNAGRSFDAVRLTPRYRKLKVDAFSGASDKIYLSGFATPTPGVHVDGLYGSIERLISNAAVEPCLL